MSKKKSTIMFILLIIIVFLLAGKLYSINNPRDFGASIAAGCSVIGYTQQQDVGYITLKIDAMTNPAKVLKVEDKELQKRLQQADLPEAIGVSIILDVPVKELTKNHISTNDFDGLDLLDSTNQYDDYFTVVGVSFDNANQ